MAGNVYTLHFKLTDGTEVPVEFIVPQGVSVTGAEINADGHLIITLSDGKAIDAGEVKGGGTSDLNLVNGKAKGSLIGAWAAMENENYKIGETAVALGEFTKARGKGSFAVGLLGEANGTASFACGENAFAHGEHSFAAGERVIASGKYAHAEGYLAGASGRSSHAEGEDTNASGDCSHAEGQWSKANSKASHAEGRYTEAKGDYSHAEGEGSRTLGKWAHAEGKQSRADSDCQHVQGKYNIADAQNKYAHIVGNGEGSGDKAYSNAHTLDWNGNAWFQGDVIVGGKSQDDADAKVLATQEYVEQKVGEIEIPEVPSLKGYATEKYVDDKIANIDFPDENDALDLLSELGFVEPLAADDGAIYTDNNNVMYVL